MASSLRVPKEDFSASRIVSWTAKGSLAILDQGLFAGTNFVANILLARWLAPDEYGAFALAFSIFLLAGMFHTALLTEPMMVFGPAKYLARFEHYLGLLFRAHWAVTAVLSLLLLGAALISEWLSGPLAGWALAGAALAAPCILFLWLVRRAFYACLRPAWAAAGGAFYCLLFLPLIVLLRAAGILAAATALAAMGGAALAVATLLVFRLHPRWRLADEGPRLREVAADHWRYGRWSAATASVAWFPASIYFVLLPVWFGLAEAGALKALMNLAMPVLQSVTALGVLLLPLLVRHRSEGGSRKMARTMRRFFVLFLSGAALYGLLLWVFRFQVLEVFYGGKYNQYAFLPFLLAGLLPLAACVSLPFEMGLRALERPDLIFKSYAAATVISLLCGVPLSAAFGSSGALAGMIVFGLATGLLSSRYCRRQSTQEESAAPRSVLQAAAEAS
jgi:O-antigen/teichoic acid export membrane protein